MITSSLKSDEIWAQKGHVAAWDQLELPWRQLAIPSDKTVGKAVLSQANDTITVSGDGFSYTFTPDGQLFSIRQNGQELLKSPIQLNVWRAPLALEVDSWDQWNITYNNRKPWNGAQIANEFYSNNLNAITRIPISCQAFESNGQVYVNVRCFSQFGAPVNTSLDAYITGLRYSGFSEVYEYRINGDGTIALHHILEPEGPMPALLPRIGLTMTLCDPLQQVKWYGRGPEENYPDRKTGYAIGIYERTVDDMFEPYLIPQDCGLRCDNRWLAMSNKQHRQPDEGGIYLPAAKAGRHHPEPGLQHHRRRLHGLLCPAWLSGQARPLRASPDHQTNFSVTTGSTILLITLNCPTAHQHANARKG